LLENHAGKRSARSRTDQADPEIRSCAGFNLTTHGLPGLWIWTLWG